MTNNTEALETIADHFNNVIPEPYRDFLKGHREEVQEDGLSLYDVSDIVERNDTFGVQRYTQEFLAVGDDSGDQLIVIRFSDALAAPFIIDAGAIVPNRPASLLKPLAKSWLEWAANGFSLR